MHPLCSTIRMIAVLLSEKTLEQPLPTQYNVLSRPWNHTVSRCNPSQCMERQHQIKLLRNTQKPRNHCL